MGDPAIEDTSLVSLGATVEEEISWTYQDLRMWLVARLVATVYAVQYESEEHRSILATVVFRGCT